jgi:hypothetical protein
MGRGNLIWHGGNERYQEKKRKGERLKDGFDDSLFAKDKQLPQLTFP